MSEPNCHAHPGVASVATCASCLKPLCATCLVFDAYRASCRDCALKSRTARRRRTWLFAGGGFVAAICGGVGLLVFAWTYEPPFDHGSYAPEVARLRSQLRSEPCDRAVVVSLADVLLQAGDVRGTLDTSEGFLAKCGDHPRLRWLTYAAHKRLGQWEQAIVEATKLIEHDPQDKDFRWWRGICYESLGRWEDAAADYEKAIELQPRLKSIPFNLADVYERMGRKCDAAGAIRRYLDHHPASADEPAVRSRLDRLSPGCPGDEAIPL